MPSKFEIVQHISRGKRKGHAEITVDFHGESITRHIINGVGRHPDDRIPGQHKRLEERIEENQRSQEHKLEAIAKLQNFSKQKPKGLDEIMRKAAVEVLTGMTEEKAAQLAAKMELERQRLVDELQVLRLTLDALRKEDPLMVRYE